MSSSALAILAGTAIKGTAILGVGWLAALALRGRSAAARHLVWAAVASAVLALPLLAIVLPALRVPLKTTGALAVFRVESVARAGGLSSGRSGTSTHPATAAASEA